MLMSIPLGLLATVLLASCALATVPCPPSPPPKPPKPPRPPFPPYPPKPPKPSPPPPPRPRPPPPSPPPPPFPPPPACCSQVQLCASVDALLPSMVFASSDCNDLADRFTDILSHLDDPFTFSCAFFSDKRFTVCATLTAAQLDHYIAMTQDPLFAFFIENEIEGLDSVADTCPELYVGAYYGYEFTYVDSTPNLDPSAYCCQDTIRQGRDCTFEPDFPFCDCPDARGEATLPFGLQAFFTSQPDPVNPGYNLWCLTSSLSQVLSEDTTDYCRQAEGVRKIDFYVAEAALAFLKPGFGAAAFVDGVRTNLKVQYASPNMSRIDGMQLPPLNGFDKQLWEEGRVDICFVLQDSKDITDFCYRPNADVNTCVYSVFEVDKDDVTGRRNGQSLKCCSTGIVNAPLYQQPDAPPLS